MLQLLVEPARTAKLRRTPPRQISPLTWLNLVCLDAPVVAVTWQWLFARSFHVPLSLYPRAALFLTAWLIYLADRLADTWSLRANEPVSLRQQFCRRHQSLWLVLIAILAIVDLWIISQRLDPAIIRLGISLGVFALAYLAINYWLGKIWRVIPVKEICVGSLFAAGTVVALVPHIRFSPTFLGSFFTFAALCSLNCISIAIWERELDRAQRKNSIAIQWNKIRRWYRPSPIALALIAIAMVVVGRTSAQLHGCVGLSALLLAVLDWLGERIPRDERTALADLVLLTPWLLVPVLMLSR